MENRRKGKWLASPRERSQLGEGDESMLYRRSDLFAGMHHNNLLNETFRQFCEQKKFFFRLIADVNPLIDALSCLLMIRGYSNALKQSFLFQTCQSRQICFRDSQPRQLFQVVFYFASKITFKYEKKSKPFQKIWSILFTPQKI